MSKKDVDHGRPRIVCTQMREARTCDNRRAYYLDQIEREVVGSLREQLGTREAISYFVRCYNEERGKRSEGNRDRRREVESEIKLLDRKIERGVAAIIDGKITEEEAAAHLPALRLRRAKLTAEIGNAMAPRVFELQSDAVKDYLRDLARLEEVINADLAAHDDGATRAVRALIETVTIMPTAPGRIPGIIVKGDLGRLLGIDRSNNAAYVGGDCGAG